MFIHYSFKFGVFQTPRALFRLPRTPELRSSAYAVTSNIIVLRTKSLQLMPMGIKSAVLKPNAVKLSYNYLKDNI